MKARAVVGVTCLLWPVLGWGEQAEEGRYQTVVTAERTETAVGRVPAAVTVVERDDVRLGQPTLGMDEAFIAVPGVFAQNRYNFAQDLRLSIRGFGARSAFGIRGIRLVVDGIPETLPDGQSQVDSLELGAVRRIEIYRGLSSPLYGNSAGGVIHLLTEDGEGPPSAEVTTTTGAGDLWKVLGRVGGEAGRLRYHATASWLTFDGMRDHSRVRALTLAAKGTWRIDAVSTLMVTAGAHDSPIAEDPGGLTAEELETSPRRAAPNNLRFSAGEAVRDVRAGAVWRRRFLPHHDARVTGFYSARSFRSSIPFTQVEFDRDFGGVILQHTYGRPFFGRYSRLSSGLEVHRQLDRRRNLNNLDGRPGDTLRLHQDEGVVSVGLFAHETLELWRDLVLHAGGRYDRVVFDVRDRLLTDGDDSGRRHFSQPTGRLGLSFSRLEALSPYASVSQSFEVPTTTELVNRPGGGGGLNPELEPQRAFSLEAGARGRVAERLGYEVAAFHTRVEGMLVREEDQEGRAFFRNAARSRHLGTEVGLRAELPLGFEARGAYTWLRATLSKGRRVPGLPEHVFGAQLQWRHRRGYHALAEWQRVSPVFADGENLHATAPYAVVNARLGYQMPGTGWRASPFVGVQNALDARYAGNVRINAMAGRYYEPAPGRLFYGGITVAWQGAAQMADGAGADAPSHAPYR
jgi:iron complex outermembrane receptor protein